MSKVRAPVSLPWLGSDSDVICIAIVVVTLACVCLIAACARATYYYYYKKQQASSASTPVPQLQLVWPHLRCPSGLPMIRTSLQGWYPGRRMMMQRGPSEIEIDAAEAKSTALDTKAPPIGMPATIATARDGCRGDPRAFPCAYSGGPSRKRGRRPRGLRCRSSL